MPFLQEVIGRRPQSEGRVADVVLVARAGKRAHAAGFGEAPGIEMHPGETRERLGRNAAEGHAVAKLAEHLAFAGAVARAHLLGEAGEDDRTAGADRVPGEGRARAEIPRAEARPCIGREIGGIDIGRACARGNANA